MARRIRPRARRSVPPTPEPPVGTPRERTIAAFMALLAEQRIERIDMADVAERAALSLAELRDEFSSPLAILAAHVKEIDRQVLANGQEDMEEELPRERLFDVLMRRLELLEPYKEAVRSLLRSARVDPPLALALNSITVRSQQWMLAAAGISSAGPKGLLRAQGLALMYANVLRTWVDDEDPGLARTMAALDDQLARGQRYAGLLDELFRIPEAACAFRDRLRRPRRYERRRGGDDEDGIPVV